MVKLVSRITLDSSSSAAYRQHVFRPACPISAAAVVVSEVWICVRVARDGRGVTSDARPRLRFSAGPRPATHLAANFLRWSGPRLGTRQLGRFVAVT